MTAAAQAAIARPALTLVDRLRVYAAVSDGVVITPEDARRAAQALDDQEAARCLARAARAQIAAAEARVARVERDMVTAVLRIGLAQAVFCALMIAGVL